MNDESNIFENRLRELDADDKRLSEKEAAIRKQRENNARERAEIVAAANVLARLTGAERPAFVEDYAEPTTEASGAKPKGIPTMPEMIFEVLSGGGLPGVALEPKSIADQIAERWWPDVPVNNVASSAWRLWKAGRLNKTGSRYSNKNEASDENPGGNASEDFFSETQAKGREAVPGGGT